MVPACECFRRAARLIPEVNNTRLFPEKPLQGALCHLMGLFGATARLQKVPHFRRMPHLRSRVFHLVCSDDPFSVGLQKRALRILALDHLFPQAVVAGLKLRSQARFFGNILGDIPISDRISGEIKTRSHYHAGREMYSVPLYSAERAFLFALPQRFVEHLRMFAA